MLHVQARHFDTASRGISDIERLVVHTAEIQEHRDSAEDVAEFFRTTGTAVSSHVVIDNNSTIRCVLDKDIAFHAKGDNLATLGAELSGFAKQSFAEWRDEYSRDVVERFAVWAAGKCERYHIPPRWLTRTQEAARLKGLVTHAIVSDVFGEGIRSDPGQFFPFELAQKRIRFHMKPTLAVFVLMDGEGDEIARSLAYDIRDPKEEADRFALFEKNRRALMLKELRLDGDYRVTRLPV